MKLSVPLRLPICSLLHSLLICDLDLIRRETYFYPSDMDHSIYIRVQSSLESYSKTCSIQLSIESLIIYAVYKYCIPNQLTLYFVFSPQEFTKTDVLDVVIADEKVQTKQFEEIPWQVASCEFPVVKYDDTIITGMCAVARHVCKHRTSSVNISEHEEGLLGFRQSCLQAPNEASVWTKFCEIDLIRTTKEILNGNHKNQFPINVVRFENHLKKPVKVHNVYKIARNLDLKSQSGEQKNREDIEEYLQMGSNRTKSRVSKNRKWKSSSNESQIISSSTPIEKLNIIHKFAEGPFFTLADLVLYPCYVLMMNYYGKLVMSSEMPSTFQWLQSCEQIDAVLSLSSDLKNILVKKNMNVLLHTCKIITPPVTDVSLYKCDPKRHNPKKRLYTKEDDIEEALSTLMEGMELPVGEQKVDVQIDWESIPAGANPKAGHLPDKRMERKSQQLENLAVAVLRVAKKGDLIVDFCSGSGHLGILVAHLLPECTIILLENREQSLLRARSRVHEMGLKNIYFFQCNLDFFVGKFDIGIALHACGIASDLVLDKCLKAKAKFIICPCCYGSLHTTDRLKYPRSVSFSSVPTDRYICIGHAADQTHLEHPLAIRGGRCMAVIDSDRGRLAEECGYTVTLSRLKPLSCTPKNNLLIGVPS